MRHRNNETIRAVQTLIFRLSGSVITGKRVIHLFQRDTAKPGLIRNFSSAEKLVGKTEIGREKMRYRDVTIGKAER
jgi:hypothetical protein